MHILIISRGIPTIQNPQSGSFEYDQAKALTKMGHKITIAAINSPSLFQWHKLGLTIKRNEDIHTYNIILSRVAVFISLWGKKAKEYVLKTHWKIIENAILEHEDKIDVIYSHYLFNTYYAVQYLSSIQAPIVGIEHWSELNREPISPDIKQLAEFTYPKVARLITVSTPLKQRISNLFAIQPQVVHNMVGDEFYYMGTPKEHIFTFISVGSLFPIKNHTLLISALAKLNLPKEKWQLIIIGEGEERIHLQKQINKEGLTHNIHLVGLKSKMDIVKMLNESNVFVLPSLSENFSVATLEALACGLPVVASICGGIRECVNKNNGLLFEVGDLDGLAKCLQFMFEHYQDYNRQAIADDCKARFSSEVIAKQLTMIFEDVIR